MCIWVWRIFEENAQKGLSTGIYLQCFFIQLDKGEQKDHVKQNWERGNLVGNKSDNPARRKIVLEK